MSIKVMTWVWEESTAKGSELLLLLALADNAADDGYCWPKIETLARKIRMSERAVMRITKTLESSGDVVVIRGNRNNRYILVMGRKLDAINTVLKHRKEKPIGDTAMSRDNLSRDTGVTSTGDMGVTRQVTQLCHPNRQEPSMNRQLFAASAAEPVESQGIGAWFQAVVTVCSIDLDLATGRQKGMVKQAAETLRKSGVTPEQVALFRKWWDSTWRGKQGQAPTVAQLREHWGEFKDTGALATFEERRVRTIQIIDPETGDTIEVEAIV